MEVLLEGKGLVMCRGGDSPSWDLCSDHVSKWFFIGFINTNIT